MIATTLSSVLLYLTPLAAQPEAPGPAWSPSAASPADPAPPALAQAGTGPAGSAFEYDYFQGLLSVGDYTGLLFELSRPLEDAWLLVGKAGFLTESDADLFTVSGGVGYVLPMQDELDLLATGEVELGYLDPDGGSSDTEVGLRARGGLRYQLNPELELFGGVGVRTIFDSDLRGDVGALYGLNEDLALVARLEFDEDTQFSIGARFGL